MNIIIVGGGKIGRTILRTLAREGHDVVAVDSDPRVIEEISCGDDVMCVCGNGVDWETLTEAGAPKAELLVAVTGSDEFNMLCCFMAKRIGTQHTVARIRNPEYNDQSLGFMRQHLDLSMAINPDSLLAGEIFQLLQLPAAANVESFAKRRFEMVELVLQENTPLHGMNLIEMRKRYPASYLVGMVQRGEEVFIPGGQFVLQSGDRIGLTGNGGEIKKLLKLLDLNRESSRNVIVIGASRTAHYLVKSLLEDGARVTVIDRDPVACEAMAEVFPDVVISCGDAANEDFLMEEGLTSADAFVSLTGLDEQNILLSYLAKSHGVKRVITKINREEFFSMAEQLGLGSIVSPKNLMTDVLLRFARALENSQASSIETLYRLMDGKAEALEFKVRGEFPARNLPLKELPLKSNTLIAGIIRGRKVILPNGNDKILEGDNVVVLTANRGLSDLADILE